jgi:hypothetical protein
VQAACALGAALCCVGACDADAISLGAGRDRADAGPAGAFSEPVAIEGIAADNGKDDDPSLSADLTLLFFNSTREAGAGKEDIWFTSRSGPLAAWRAPEQARELNSPDRETGIALSPDGLSILFSSDREGGSGGLDVYAARRSDRAQPWSMPERVEELCSSQDDLVSGLGGNERSVYLARRNGEDDDYDLFIAWRASAEDPWGEPTTLAALNSDEAESDGFEVESGAQLLFTRDEDLYLARRDADSGEFEMAAPLSDLNSAEDDRDAWASPDLSYVVFSSNRTGEYLLYETQR